MGTVFRLLADVGVAVWWHASLVAKSPAAFSADDWAVCLRRVAFIWMATLPKATLQASLGPKLTSTFSAGGFVSAAGFIAPSAAVSILYAASIGSTLTHTAGFALAKYLQAHESGNNAASERKLPVAGGEGSPKAPEAKALVFGEGGEASKEGAPVAV